MKRFFLILALGLFACAAQAVEPIVSLLATNVATWRDEMFRFRVTFSDVRLETNEFQFTQNMFHQEAEGSIRGTMKYALPLNILKSSSHDVVTDEDIGKNIMVKIELPLNTPSNAIVVTTEMVDSNGKKTVETKTIADFKEEINGKPYFNCEIYFPDEKTARAWNNELSKLLKIN